jgi:hypothetical protein
MFSNNAWISLKLNVRNPYKGDYKYIRLITLAESIPMDMLKDMIINRVSMDDKLSKTFDANQIMEYGFGPDEVNKFNNHCYFTEGWDANRAINEKKYEETPSDGSNEKKYEETPSDGSNEKKYEETPSDGSNENKIGESKNYPNKKQNKKLHSDSSQFKILKNLKIGRVFHNKISKHSTLCSISICGEHGNKFYLVNIISSTLAFINSIRLHKNDQGKTVRTNEHDFRKITNYLHAYQNFAKDDYFIYNSEIRFRLKKNDLHYKIEMYELPFSCYPMIIDTNTNINTLRSKSNDNQIINSSTTFFLNRTMSDSYMIIMYGNEEMVEYILRSLRSDFSIYLPFVLMIIIVHIVKYYRLYLKQKQIPYDDNEINKCEELVRKLTTIFIEKGNTMSKKFHNNLTSNGLRKYYSTPDLMSQLKKYHATLDSQTLLFHKIAPFIEKLDILDITFFNIVCHEDYDFAVFPSLEYGESYDERDGASHKHIIWYIHHLIFNENNLAEMFEKLNRISENFVSYSKRISKADVILKWDNLYNIFGKTLGEKSDVTNSYLFNLMCLFEKNTSGNYVFNKKKMELDGFINYLYQSKIINEYVNIYIHYPVRLKFATLHIHIPNKFYQERYTPELTPRLWHIVGSNSNYSYDNVYYVNNQYSLLSASLVKKNPLVIFIDSVRDFVNKYKNELQILIESDNREKWEKFIRENILYEKFHEYVNKPDEKEFLKMVIDQNYELLVEKMRNMLEITKE